MTLPKIFDILSIRPKANCIEAKCHGEAQRAVAISRYNTETTIAPKESPNPTYPVHRTIFLFATVSREIAASHGFGAMLLAMTVVIDRSSNSPNMQSLKFLGRVNDPPLQLIFKNLILIFNQKL